MTQPTTAGPVNPDRARPVVPVLIGALISALIGACLAGCGPGYTCPDPIGPIVRDDCDVYQTRYEALKVELGVTFAGIGVGVDVGEQSIRDPSELLQVLKLQTMALCRDYNTCRVQPAEYRARREAMDTRYAAIIALTEQLRAADDRATRRQLVGSLVEILRRPVAVTETPDPSTGKQLSPFRDVTSMWIGGQNQPPMPSDLPRATPALAWWQPISIRSGRRSTTRVFLRFRGPAAADDFAYVLLPKGAPDPGGADAVPEPGPGAPSTGGTPPGWVEARCAVRPDGPRAHDPERAPQARASCDFDDLEAPPTAGRMIVDYRPGLTGERHRLGSVPLSPVARLEEAWLAYLPTPVGAEPIDHERPWLVFFRPEDRTRNVTVRCTVNDEPLGAAIRARSAMRRLGGLTRYHVPLPVSLPRSGSAVAEPGDRSPADAAGRWSCRISALGAPLRTVTFDLDAAGRPVSTTAGGTGGIAPGWWPLTPLR